MSEIEEEEEELIDEPTIEKYIQPKVNSFLEEERKAVIQPKAQHIDSAVIKDLESHSHNY